MKKKKIKLELVLIAAFVAVAVATAGYYFLFSKEDKAGNTVADNVFGWEYPVVEFPTTGPNELAYSDIRDPGGIPQGLPVRLKIPIIRVDSAIEDALITPDGRMDVPAGSKNVAWFALGPYPGKVGSAVIGGHFGISQGVKFVFYDLDKLKVGDKVYILDDAGATLAFQVRSIKLFDRNADATTVFTSNDGLAHLNLITCEGIWNRVNDTYPARRVVFTDAIPSEGAAPAGAKPVEGTVAPTGAASTETLRVGSKGTNVTALQTALVQKGFLTIPRGVAKGYFGALTRTAVAQYQTSVGLASNGVFDSLTKAKLFAKPIAVEPTLPTTAMLDSTPTPISKTLIQAARSLFATPMDGLITLVLLCSIIFMAFKIIKVTR